MARRQSIAPLKLVFLVEGDAEKTFLETLVPRILGPKVVMRVIRVGPKSAFSSTFFEAAKFLDAGYASVFVLLDADTLSRSEIEVQKRQLAQIYRRYGLQDHVQIHFAVPMLETWLLAGNRAHPERSTDPKRDLARLTGTNTEEAIRKLTTELPIDVARSRSRSFDAFLRDLEAFASSKARRAS
jgi:hypothetical protein